jgi:hypothetical protein
MAQQAKVRKASKELQIKAGTGKVSGESIKKAEKALDSNKADFKPMARDYLKRLDEAIEQVRRDTSDMQACIHAMSAPVMDLKANASMFDYQCVTNLAGIMLNFLETIEKLDKEVIEIVDAHRKTLEAIVARGMTGSGGKQGEVLQKELQDAINRYYKKHGIKARV